MSLKIDNAGEEEEVFLLVKGCPFEPLPHIFAREIAPSELISAVNAESLKGYTRSHTETIKIGGVF